MPVSDYSTTPSDNTSISGLAVTDSTVASTLDNIIRQLMADIRLADNANAKTGNLGLGTMATQNAVAVNIDGGTVDVTTLGASIPAPATVTNLGVTGLVNLSSSASNPRLDFKRQADADTHEVTSFTREANLFVMKTRTAADALVSTDYEAAVEADGVAEHVWSTRNVQRLSLVTGTLRPITSGGLALGSTTRPFSTAFLVSSPNITSDARLKADIADFTEAERRAAGKIKARTFTMNGQKKIGYIAQEIIAAMASEGLCAFEYGLVTDGETYSVDMDAINAFRLG